MLAMIYCPTPAILSTLKCYESILKAVMCMPSYCLKDTCTAFSFFYLQFYLFFFVWLFFTASFFFFFFCVDIVTNYIFALLVASPFKFSLGSGYRGYTIEYMTPISKEKEGDASRYSSIFLLQSMEAIWGGRGSCVGSFKHYYYYYYYYPHCFLLLLLLLLLPGLHLSMCSQHPFSFLFFFLFFFSYTDIFKTVMAALLASHYFSLILFWRQYIFFKTHLRCLFLNWSNHSSQNLAIKIYLFEF